MGTADKNIESWLRGLGLERYISTFRENDIDGEILLEITERDFEKLGVSPMPAFASGERDKT
jgi:hypothetical protein